MDLCDTAIIREQFYQDALWDIHDHIRSSPADTGTDEDWERWGNALRRLLDEADRCERLMREAADAHDAEVLHNYDLRMGDGYLTARREDGTEDARYLAAMSIDGEVEDVAFVPYSKSNAILRHIERNGGWEDFEELDEHGRARVNWWRRRKDAEARKAASQSHALDLDTQP